MVNRQIRRPSNGTSKPTVIVSEPISGDKSTVVIESRTEQIIDRDSESDDTKPNVIIDKPKRIGIVEIDPERIAEFVAERADSGDGSGERKPRRKRSPNGTRRDGNGKSKEASQNVEALVSMVHTWASVLLKTPELMLDDSEVKSLSDAYTKFSQYHEVPLLSAKRVSEVNLVAVALSLYGSRFIAIRNRKKEEAKPQGIHGVPQQVRAAQHPVM
jgi:hypothetical protein